MFNFSSMLPWVTTTPVLPWMASTYTSLVMLRSMSRDFVPPLLQDKIFSIMGRLFATSSRTTFTLIISEYSGCQINEMYEAAETYTRAKINTPSLHRLAVSKLEDEKSLTVRVAKDEDVVDVFQGIPLTWKFVSEKEPNQPGRQERRFELTFCNRHKELVLSAYLPHVMEASKAIMQENLTLKLFSTGLHGGGDYRDGAWGGIKLDHPATFDTLAMDENLKKKIIQDLDRFLERREYYRRVGKAWKRGYLLYGPPGTGKSSLIAAIANYLKFNIYELELTNVCSNSYLRNLLVATKNRSIIVIEDIDCSAELKDRKPMVDEEESDSEYKGASGRLTLSGLLNSIDGLWSSCGEERIIIFTTNYKDKIDPALLRPGRMDMHIHMSYCTASGFKILASKYLGLSEENRRKLYSEIADQIEESRITPAEVAEELMRSEDADTALAGLGECLKRKRADVKDGQNQSVDEPKQASKRRKVGDRRRRL